MTDFLIGTPVQGWRQLSASNGSAYNQFWYLIPVPGTDKYTLYNLGAGTVLEISNGQSCGDLM